MLSNIRCNIFLQARYFYKQVLDATSRWNVWGIILSKWNNKFKVKNKHGVEVLCFTRWINSDIIFVKDLKKLNNNIREQFFFENVGYKNSIISEVMQIKHVLKPYKHIIRINELSNNVDEENFSPILNTTVKQFYINFRDLNFIPAKIKKWIQLIGDISEKKQRKVL